LLHLLILHTNFDMSDDEERNKRLSGNERDFLKLPEADTLDGMVLKSLSEHNVSSMRKVSEACELFDVICGSPTFTSFRC